MTDPHSPKIQSVFYWMIIFARIVLFPLKLYVLIYSAIIKHFFSTKKYSIVTMGGTAGHIFPAIRFTARAASRGTKIRIVTNKLSKKLILKLGNIVKDEFVYSEDIFDLHRPVKIIFLPSVPLYKKVKPIILFGLSLLQSFVLFLKNAGRIENIISFGGYASFPMMFWCIIFGKKSYIHEQNVVFGLVNCLFLPFATKVFTAFACDEHSKQVCYVGMPLPRFVETRSLIIRDKSRRHSPTILIISGSSGDSDVTHTTLGAIFLVTKKLPNAKIYHQVPAHIMPEIIQKYKEHNINADVAPFFENIHALLPSVDLCISRSGALSIVDLLSSGVITIFIPAQNSAHNHQIKNAIWVVKNNLGFMFKPWESNVYNLASLINFSLHNYEANALISKKAQIAIKRNTRSIMHHYIF